MAQEPIEAGRIKPLPLAWLDWISHALMGMIRPGGSTELNYSSYTSKLPQHRNYY